jgi:hypothetical protein
MVFQMKKTTPLASLQEMDELLAFIPVFSDKDFNPIISWHGGVKKEDGVITLPFPEYDQITVNFFMLLSKECWVDYDYDPVKIGKMLRDYEYVKNSSLEQIKSLLTYCNRGERFMDGHWDLMIKDGHVHRILQRLRVIRSQMK